MDPLLTVALAAAAGGVIQAATGFGFALVCAPVAFGRLDPGTAIWALTLLALLVNVLTLATEGRRPRPLRGDSAWLLAWSLPGALAGVALLRGLGDAALQVLVTAAVLGSLAVLRRAPRGRAAHRAWQRPAAGAAMGALSTSTGTGGPPLVLYLLARGVGPDRVRDTLGAVFGASALVAAAVLAATGTGPLPGGDLLAAGAGAALAGHLAGRRAFARLRESGYDAALAAVLVASVAGGLLQALG